MMASTEKPCEYIKCKEMFFGGKRARFCCPKHGTYQRRLDKKELDNEKLQSSK